MKKWDVIVVGSGPGGATCAWKCAEAGLETLLLDRAPSLPRYKPCGGGIPAALARHLPGLEPDAFADLAITRLHHSWKGRRSLLAEMTTDSGAPAEVWMVQRPRFDFWLAQKARSCGAEIRPGTRIAQVALESDAPTVTLTTAEGEKLEAQHVVGADGAKGIVGPRVGLRLKRQYGMAREIEIPFSHGLEDNRWHPSLQPGTAYLDYGSVPNGYAWIFPKRGFLSVGAGMLLPNAPAAEAQNRVGRLLLQAMETLLASVGLTLPAGPDAPPLWAHPIPFWTGAEPLATNDGRVLLVGDAAGVVQPLFGEGIQYAMRTGAMAAGHIAGGTAATAYTEAVRETFAAEFDAALRVGRAFHRAPYLSYRLGVSNPAGTRLVGRIMAGEAHFADLEQRIYERLKNPFQRARPRPQSADDSNQK